MLLPTTYVFVEKYEKYEYIWIEKMHLIISYDAAQMPHSMASDLGL